jgi:hypothetical protein
MGWSLSPRIEPSSSLSLWLTAWTPRAPYALSHSGLCPHSSRCLNPGCGCSPSCGSPLLCHCIYILGGRRGRVKRLSAAATPSSAAPLRGRAPQAPVTPRPKAHAILAWRFRSATRCGAAGQDDAAAGGSSRGKRAYTTRQAPPGGGRGGHPPLIWPHPRGSDADANGAALGTALLRKTVTPRRRRTSPRELRTWTASLRASVCNGHRRDGIMVGGCRRYR